jgi:hypothetical protein
MEVTYLWPPWLTGSYHPRCDVQIGKRDWMTTFQPAFRGAIIEGKARSVMCSVRASAHPSTRPP